jgi:hypothetical protein
VQAYLAKLEKDDPAKIQTLGVRGLRKLIEAELNAANRAGAEDEIEELPEPKPPRRTAQDQLNEQTINTTCWWLGCATRGLPSVAYTSSTTRCCSTTGRSS